MSEYKHRVLKKTCIKNMKMQKHKQSKNNKCDTPELQFKSTWLQLFSFFDLLKYTFKKFVKVELKVKTDYKKNLHDGNPRESYLKSYMNSANKISFMRILLKIY